MERMTNGRVRSVTAGALVVVMLLIAAACGGSKSAPTLTSPNDTGRELVTEFLSILQGGDVGALDQFLDPAFQLERPDGTGEDKSSYLKSPAKVSAFTISPDIEARQHDDVLTVRWSVSADETVGGTKLQTAVSPRLSTFHWNGSEWQLLSHANFNRVS